MAPLCHLFPFIDQNFIDCHLKTSHDTAVSERHHHSHRLISVDVLGDDTGFASSIAKIVVDHVCQDQICLKHVGSYIVKSIINVDISDSTMVSREFEFYQDLAKHVSPQYAVIPRIYGRCSVTEQGGRTTQRLILEHIGRPLWTSCNAAEKEMSLDHVKGAIASLALLHTFPIEKHQRPPVSLWLTEVDQRKGYFGSVDALLRSATDQLFPPCGGNARSRKSFLKDLPSTTYQKCREKIAPLLVGSDVPIDEALAVFVEVGERLRELSSTLYRVHAEKSLLHMDARAENMFFKLKDETSRAGPQEGCFADADPAAVTLIDWQMASIGPPVLDIAYFMTGSLSVDQRRKLEVPILRYYLERRSALRSNVEESLPLPSLPKLRQLYAIATLWPVVWALVCMAGGEEGLEAILDSGNKHEVESRQKWRHFMRVSSQRQLQAAIDHRSARRSSWSS